MTTGNLQANESLINVAWSNMPKVRNYNRSESFNYRCSAAACQFNTGNGYVGKEYEKAGLTPQKKTDDVNRAKDRKRK